jgi:hypothetical protein
MGTEEHFFDFASGDYLFSFSEEDDFSEVKILNLDEDGRESGSGGWELTEENPYVGNRCIKWTGSQERSGNAWLFSRGFEFFPGPQYVAGIYYCGSGERLARFDDSAQISDRVKNPLMLNLRLGVEQEPDAMTRSLFDLGVTNEEYQSAKIWFEVPERCVYYFSLHAHGDPANGSIFVGRNGAALSGGLEDF